MTKNKQRDNNPHELRVALVVPHIFMQDVLLDDVIFSPAELAFSLGAGIQAAGHCVDLWTPGPVTTPLHNPTGDMSGFSEELDRRGYGFIELLKKHPLTFASLARQVQADMLAQVYAAANDGRYDVVHVYTNEEDIGLQFAQFCTKPVVFTHHDPFNLTVGYKTLFPKKKHLCYIAMSESQKKDMPPDTNWVATIPHGMSKDALSLGDGTGGYVAYIGRIIYAKGVHHAIAAVNHHNKTATTPLKLKIAGKYYQDSYFEEYIQPHLGEYIEFVGYVRGTKAKQEFLGNARAALVPAIYEEPFGMTTIESLACGTPVIGLDHGALSEIVEDGVSGFVVPGGSDQEIAENMASCIGSVGAISRSACRSAFEKSYTLERMVASHEAVYVQLVNDAKA